MQILPFILNNMLNNNINMGNNGNSRSNNINSNTYNRENKRENSKGRKEKNKKNKENNDLENSFNQLETNFNETFNNIFNQVFTTVVSNRGLIDNIVNSVLNSNTMTSILENLEQLNLELKFIESYDKYIIEGNLKGVNKKDIDIDYNNDNIVVKVNKRQGFSNESNTVMAFIDSGEILEKSFYVPNVDSAKIKAVFNSDLLHIYLPKKIKIEDNNTIIDVDNFIET